MVLVVIGLIVGGVLVGQDLIKSAEARAQITQIEKFNSAVNTFYGKYGGLPGDLNSTLAAQFGFVARAGTQGRGDGNGVIEGVLYSNGTIYAWEQNGETSFFWEDLSQANLIDGKFDTAIDAAYSCYSYQACSSFMPQAKIGKGNFVFVYSGSAVNCCATWSGLTPNFFSVAAISSIVNGATSPISSITVQQAYNIDKKIDDGIPVSGTVVAQYPSGPGGTYPGGQSWGIGWAANAATGSSTTCFDSSTGAAAYSLTQTSGSSLNCGLSFKMQGAAR